MFNYITGILLCLYGLFVIVMRVLKKEKSFHKLPAMREKFGSLPGSLIHILFYGILPLFAGLLFLFLASRGISFLEL